MIDARGLLCPLPVLKLAKALRATKAGGRVELWADDAMAQVDVPHFCTEAGHLLVKQSDRDGFQVYVVEAQGASAAE